MNTQLPYTLYPTPYTLPPIHHTLYTQYQMNYIPRGLVFDTK